jgi:hypothetical protein
MGFVRWAHSNFRIVIPGGARDLLYFARRENSRFLVASLLGMTMLGLVSQEVRRRYLIQPAGEIDSQQFGKLLGMTMLGR